MGKAGLNEKQSGSTPEPDIYSRMYSAGEQKVVPPTILEQEIVRRMSVEQELVDHVTLDLEMRSHVVSEQYTWEYLQAGIVAVFY